MNQYGVSWNIAIGSIHIFYASALFSVRGVSQVADENEALRPDGGLRLDLWRRGGRAKIAEHQRPYQHAISALAGTRYHLCKAHCSCSRELCCRRAWASCFPPSSIQPPQFWASLRPGSLRCCVTMVMISISKVPLHRWPCLGSQLPTCLGPGSNFPAQDTVRTSTGCGPSWQ